MRWGCRDSQPGQAAELPRQGSSDPSLGYGVRNPRGILRSHPWHPGFPRWIPYAPIYSSCWKLLSADLLRVFQPKGGGGSWVLSGIRAELPVHQRGVCGHAAHRAELDTAWTAGTAPYAPGWVLTGWEGALGRLGAQPGGFQPLPVPVVPSAPRHWRK